VTKIDRQPIPSCLVRKAKMELVRAQELNKPEFATLRGLLFMSDGRPQDNKLIVGDSFFSKAGLPGEYRFEMEVAKDDAGLADDYTERDGNKVVKVDPNGEGLKRMGRASVPARIVEERVSRAPAVFHEYIHAIQNQQRFTFQHSWGEWVRDVSRFSSHRQALQQNIGSLAWSDLGRRVEALQTEYRHAWEEQGRILAESRIPGAKWAQAVQSAFAVREDLVATLRERAVHYEDAGFPEGRWPVDVHAAESEEEYFAIFVEQAWRAYVEDPVNWPHAIEQRGYAPQEIAFLKRWWAATFSPTGNPSDGPPFGACLADIQISAEDTPL
jgi:hypothetical protein